ncbi:MAG: PAQR family membrane homeostasis protein TrhA [Treponema sp.]
MTREDEIAANAVRLATLKSLKIKKQLRIQQIREIAEAKIREINIQYAEDPARLKAKYAAEDYARSEKAKRRAARAIAREKAHIARQNKMRPFTFGEEIFSAIVQGIGACLFIAATALLDIAAAGRMSGHCRAVYLALFTCFGVLMVANYILSILHHALTPDGAKEVFNRLCRSMSFLIIACAFAAYSYKICSFSNVFVLIVSAIVWALCLAGILLYSIAGSRLEVVNIILYAVLGWAALFIIKGLYQTLSVRSFRLLIAAGIFYTIGLAFFSMRKVKFFHAIGNTVMLLASVYLFFSLLFIV